MSSILISSFLTSINSSTSSSEQPSVTGKGFFDDLFNKISNFFKDNGLELLIRIALAIAIIIIGHYLIKLLCFILKKSLSHPRKNGKTIDKGIVTFTSSAFKFLLTLALIFIVFSILKIPLNSLASIISAAVLAIGLSLQDTMSNFSNGIFLLSSKNFQTGDYIEVDGVEGTVLEFNMMSIVLRSPDNKKIVIPNSIVAKSIITNYSSEKTRRISLKFSVSYDSDIDVCRKIILDVVSKNEKVLSDPASSVSLSNLDSSSLELTLKCYVNNPDYWSTYYELNETIFNTLRAKGIEIPFNKLDVNITEENNEKKVKVKSANKKGAKNE